MLYIVCCANIVDSKALGKSVGLREHEIYRAICSSVRRRFGKRYGSGDDDDAARCVEGIQRRRYRCRAITPLLYIRRAFATRRAAHFVNFAYQSSERKRDGERALVMHVAGHGTIRDIDA